MNKIEKYLTKLNVDYEIREYSLSCKNASEASLEMNFPYSQMYKTLLCIKNGKNIIIVIPSNQKISNEFDLASKETVKKITGYDLGTVSPLCLKHKISILIDKSAEIYQKISIGCGEIGRELIISPNDLIRITSATVRQLTTEGK